MDPWPDVAPVPLEASEMPSLTFCLTTDWLISRSFSFTSQPGSRLVAPFISFLRDGSIGIYRHHNEAKWLIEDGALVILSASGIPTCIAKPSGEEEGRMQLAGPFLLAEGISHCFRELKSESDYATISTFDLFDTLVARKCYDPIAIFRAVET
jgi:hypothetical protein